MEHGPSTRSPVLRPVLPPDGDTLYFKRLEPSVRLNWMVPPGPAYVRG